MNLFDRALSMMLPIVPKAIVGRVARRYVAGAEIEEALDRVRKLSARGASSTVDVLGEEIKELSEGEETAQAYLDVLNAIAEHGLDSNISVKLTAFGLRQDEDVCYTRLRGVVERARELDNFVRIDMEDSSTTDATLAQYRRLRKDGFDNCGAVLQAYMRRTLDDVDSLAELVPGYRICKGIYIEPEPVAYQEFDEVNRNYLASLERMLKGGSFVGIATHDRKLVEGAFEIIKRMGLGPEQYEFQMLLGVEEALGDEIIAAGHRMRVYVPYGREWYAYCVRRLKENPKIGRYVLLAMFRR